MTDKPRWGDLIALGVGAGVIAYYARGSRERFAGATASEWWDTAIVILPTIAALVAVTYLVLRLWDLLTGRRR